VIYQSWGENPAIGNSAALSREIQIDEIIKK
jgi:hypothetical protein